MKSINFARDEVVLRIQRGAFGGWWLVVGVVVVVVWGGVRHVLRFKQRLLTCIH